MLKAWDLANQIALNDIITEEVIRNLDTYQLKRMREIMNYCGVYLDPIPEWSAYRVKWDPRMAFPLETDPMFEI